VMGFTCEGKRASSKGRLVQKTDKEALCPICDLQVDSWQHRRCSCTAPELVSARTAGAHDNQVAITTKGILRGSYGGRKYFADLAGHRVSDARRTTRVDARNQAIPGERQQANSKIEYAWEGTPPTSPVKGRPRSDSQSSNDEIQDPLDADTGEEEALRQLESELNWNEETEGASLAELEDCQDEFYYKLSEAHDGKQPACEARQRILDNLLQNQSGAKRARDKDSDQDEDLLLMLRKESLKGTAKSRTLPQELWEQPLPAVASRSPDHVLFRGISSNAALSPFDKDKSKIVLADNTCTELSYRRACAFKDEAYNPVYEALARGQWTVFSRPSGRGQGEEETPPDGEQTEVKPDVLTLAVGTRGQIYQGTLHNLKHLGIPRRAIMNIARQYVHSAITHLHKILALSRRIECRPALRGKSAFVQTLRPRLLLAATGQRRKRGTKRPRTEGLVTNNKKHKPGSTPNSQDTTPGNAGGTKRKRLVAKKRHPPPAQENRGIKRGHVEGKEVANKRRKANLPPIRETDKAREKGTKRAPTPMIRKDKDNPPPKRKKTPQASLPPIRGKDTAKQGKGTRRKRPRGKRKNSNSKSPRGQNASGAQSTARTDTTRGKGTKRVRTPTIRKDGDNPPPKRKKTPRLP